MPILKQLAQIGSVLLAISTAACVAGSDDGGRPSDDQADWRSGGKADGQSCDANMPAAAYYGQFDYKATTTETGSTWYRVGLTWDVKATLDNGDQASMRGYFLADHRVIVEYSEEHRVDSSQSTVLNQTVLVTRAHIDDTTRAITIDGIGAGTPIAVNSDNGGGCVPGIALTYAGDIRSAGLKGDVTHLVAGLTSAYVIDPDHLDQVQNETARRYFEEDVASGKIKVVHVP